MFNPDKLLFVEKADGRRAKSAIRKDRRQIALERRDKGDTFVAIAKELGVHARTVQHWCAQAGEIGAKAVIEGQRRGANLGDGRVLNPEQEREIVGLITSQLPGAPFRLWCVRALMDLILERFELQISRRSVGNYLARWGIDPKIPFDTSQAREIVLKIRGRVSLDHQREHEGLIFWAGEMTPPCCSGLVGERTNGDIPMLYALTGKGEVFFMFETDQHRDNQTLWARFVEALGAMASEKKTSRTAFVLVLSPKGMNKQLMALYALKLGRTRTRQSFEIFYV